MSDELHRVVLFHSTSHALRAERVLQKAGIGCKLIPIPRHISSDCGVCIRIVAGDEEPARQALHEVGVEIEAVWPV